MAQQPRWRRRWRCRRLHSIVFMDSSVYVGGHASIHSFTTETKWRETKKAFIVDRYISSESSVCCVCPLLMWCDWMNVMKQWFDIKMDRKKEKTEIYSLRPSQSFCANAIDFLIRNDWIIMISGSFNEMGQSNAIISLRQTTHAHAIDRSVYKDKRNGN